MQKGGHILRQGQEQAKSSFWEVPGGVILRGLEEVWKTGNRCSGSSHDFAQAAVGAKSRCWGMDSSPSILPGPRTVS